jgi:hypothetical protein
LASQTTKPVLDPLDRTTEAVFGLLMALTFTGAASVVSVENPGQILAAALACNIAWGFTDAVMYLLSTSIGRRRRGVFLARMRTADPDEATGLLRDALGDLLPEQTSPQRIGVLVEWTQEAGRDGIATRLGADDYRAALAVFLTVVGATFPPVVPLFLFEDGWTALRISNLVSLLFLVLMGRVLDRLIDGRWRFGLLMPVIGLGLVSTIIALGG